MKKKYLLGIIIFIAIVNCTGYANADLSASSIVSKADSFVNGGKLENTIELSSMQSLSKDVSGILLGIGIIVAVGAGIFLGVKYMTETAEGRAKVMDSLVPFVIGCIVIFGAYGIWYAFITFANGF